MITSENGKDLIEGVSLRRKLIYPAGAEDARKLHVHEVNDRGFFELQEDKVKIPMDFYIKKDKEVTDLS